MDIECMEQMRQSYVYIYIYIYILVRLWLIAIIFRAVFIFVVGVHWMLSTTGLLNVNEAMEVRRGCYSDNGRKSSDGSNYQSWKLTLQWISVKYQ